MYESDPDAAKPEIKLPKGNPDKKVATLEAKITALSDRLSRVIADNEQLRRDIKRNAQDIQLLTNAVAKRK